MDYTTNSTVLKNIRATVIFVNIPDRRSNCFNNNFIETFLTKKPYPTYSGCFVFFSSTLSDSYDHYVNLQCSVYKMGLLLLRPFNLRLQR